MERIIQKDMRTQRKTTERVDTTGIPFQGKTVRSLHGRLLEFSILIQGLVLLLIGVFFYRSVSSQILEQNISLVRNKSQNIASELQYWMSGIISSAYAISINNSVSTAIASFRFNPDINSQIKLDALVSDSIDEAVYESKRLVKTAFFVLDGKVHGGALASVENDLSYNRISPLLENTEGYMSVLPRQKDPVAYREGTVIPMIFSIQYGTVKTKLVFLLDYNVLKNRISKVATPSDILILDRNGHIVFCENPLYENNIAHLATDRPFAEGFYEGKYNGKFYLRTEATVPSIGWVCHLFSEKDEVLDQFNFAITIFFVVLIAIFSLEILLYYIVYKRLTTPLTRLAQVMSHPVDEHSTYRHFSYDKDDEIGAVSRSYNQMIETIDQLVQNLNDTIEDLKDKSEQIEWVQEQKREAEIKALQAQINPHFLYNTLNSISWLAVEQGADEAARLANTLASYYEISLSKGVSEIPLSREAEHVTKFLAIEQTRYREVLSYSVDIPSAFRSIPIPKITLQPLAENALYHGLRPLKRMGHITIRAMRDGTDIVITVSDDGQPMSKEKMRSINLNLSNGTFDPSSGYGIYNVNARLRLTFGPTYGLNYYHKGTLTCVDVRIPAEGGGA